MIEINTSTDMTGLEYEPVNMKITHDKTVKLFDNFCLERNIAEGTAKSYRSALTKFCRWYGDDNLLEFIEDCHREEDALVPQRKRMLKKTLLDYRNFLFETISHNAVKTYFSKLLTFLRHYDVEIPELPNAKYHKQSVVGYYELPNREHIRDACHIARIDIKALILFMSSSGTAKAETLSLKVEDWIKGCSDYIPENLTELGEIISHLTTVEDIVPIIYLRRIKTDKYYYTCCSPEASEEINKYLMFRLGKDKVFDWDSPLFDLQSHTVLGHFQKINDDLGWGFVGKYRFFRTHALRKYFASNIGLTPDMVDMLEGRSRGEIHETYIKTNPEELRNIYKTAMHRVMIYDNSYQGWDSVPPKLTTQYKDNGKAVITLKFTIPTSDVNKCMSFINSTFYTK